MQPLETTLRNSFFQTKVVTAELKQQEQVHHFITLILPLMMGEARFSCSVQASVHLWNWNVFKDEYLVVQEQKRVSAVRIVLPDKILHHTNTLKVQQMVLFGQTT